MVVLLAGQTRLAEELERWIQRQRVSYAHVARFSGVSPNTLSYVRTGSGRKIQQETLRKIAHGLATDPYSHEIDAVVYRAAWTDLAAATGHPHEPWLLFSLGTGVRLGEARALLWADVDLQAGTATIRASLDNSTSERGPTKTRRIRTVDLPDAVVVALAALRKRQQPGELLVFGHDGRAYRARSYRSWLSTRCREAGVPELPPHSLRHTFASLALDAGVPIQDISRALGHANVATTMSVYSHYIGDQQRRTANALGAALNHRFSGQKADRVQINGTR